MSAFPDESLMERSADGSEPIRGGSVAINRILGRFVKNASVHQRPEFGALLVSAFSIFQSVQSDNKDAKLEHLEALFVKDITLLMDYYTEYLSDTMPRNKYGQKYPMVVYFPTYDKIDKVIRREHKPDLNTTKLLGLYKQFYSRNALSDDLIKTTRHVNCYSVVVGRHDYPHRELARKFQSLGGANQSAYTPSDAIAVITSVVLDYHITGRLRYAKILERYTGELKDRRSLGHKLDKSGRIPFHPVSHLLFGDSLMIQPMMDRKTKAAVLAQSEKEHWENRTVDDVIDRLIRTTNLSAIDKRKYDFV